MIFQGTKEYLQWLKTTDCDLDKNNEYNLLFRDLYSTHFVSIVNHDINRIYEALSIREEYDGESGLYPQDVTMLELIRSLAMKCSEICFDALEVLDVTDWFWKLMGHIGLDKFTDSEYHDYGGSEAVRNILYKIIRRTYHSSGKGGLFPMKNTKKDQRRVELWYQMNEYVLENYF